MDSKKRRSLLRKSIAADNGSTDTKTQLKRRISFCGKNSVREFFGEEEPKTWNNSYEISDHLNGNETASNLCAPSMSKELRSALKNTSENKENYQQSSTTQQDSQIENNNQQKINKNVSISNNVSLLSTTKDLINITYQNQNSKIYPINNSVDITLYESEMKFQAEGNKTAATNIYSFSMEDDEKDVRSIMNAEKTMDFMRELRSESLNRSNTHGFNDKGVTVFSEYMEEDFSILQNKKDPITIYMNDSMSTSTNECADSNFDRRKSIKQPIAMQLSPNKEKLYDKENIHPSANETQNNSCQMEIDDNKLSPPKNNYVNVEKESQAFQEKLNELSFLQEPDDNIIIDDVKPKSRTTINFNESIKMSPPKQTIFKSKVDLRSTINFNQPITVSPPSKNKNSEINAHNKNEKSRKSINFDKTMEFSPKKDITNLDNNIVPRDNTKLRSTINFNQSIEIDSKTVNDVSYSKNGAIPKWKKRPTINFNEDIEHSPPKDRANELKKIDNLGGSPITLSQEPVSNTNLFVSGNIRKNSQPPKILVRKICTPLVNKTKNPIDLEQQRLLRYKKKQEQNVAAVTSVESEAETAKQIKADKSLNFSLSSVKNISMSPESISPLIPSEYRALNMKQLNDELERGKINIFPNVPKTPISDRKARMGASNFHTKNVILPQRKTLVFENADIPISNNDTLNKDSKILNLNNYFEFNTTQDVIALENRKNPKCRYSQADDLMLDNTSFLTRAKLSDETISRNSSKREFTQFNDIFDESLRDAASKLPGSSVKIRKPCNKEKDTLSSMFKNVKPIFTQTIANIRDSNNFNFCDEMDVSHEIDPFTLQKSQNSSGNNIHHRQTLFFNNEIEKSCKIDQGVIHNRNDLHANKNEEMEFDDLPVEKSTSQTIFLHNDIEQQEKEYRTLRKTLNLHEVIDQDSVTNDNVCKQNLNENHCATKCARQTTYLNKDIEESINDDAKCNVNYKNDKVMDTLNVFNVNLDDKPMEISMYCEDNNEGVECNDVNIHKRQTLYQYEDIAVEEIADEEQKSNCNSFEGISKDSRRTHNFNNDIIPNNVQVLDQLQDTKFINLKPNRQTEDLKVRNKVSQPRESIHIVQDLDITLNEDKHLNSEALEMPVKNNLHSDESNQMRKTTYFNHEIHLEPETCILIEENKTSARTFNTNPARKTLYFNSQIPLENCELEKKNDHSDIFESHNMQQQAQNNVFPKNISEPDKNIHTGQDLLMTLNNEVSNFQSLKSKDLNVADFKNDGTDENCFEPEKAKVSAVRKSIYTPEGMDLTFNEDRMDKIYTTENKLPHSGTEKTKVSVVRESFCTAERMDVKFNDDKEQEQQSNKTENKHYGAKKTKQKAVRKSIYTAESMDLTLNEERMEHKNKTEQKISDFGKYESYRDTTKSIGKSIFTAEGMDIIVNDEMSEQVNRRDLTFNDKRMNKSYKTENKLPHSDTEKTKVSAVRKSIYTAEGMDVTLNDDRIQEQQNNKTETKQNAVRKSIYTAESMDMTLNEERMEHNNKTENKNPDFGKYESYGDGNKTKSIRKSIYTAERMDIIVNDEMSEQVNKAEIEYPISDNDICNGEEEAKQTAVQKSIYLNEERADMNNETEGKNSHFNKNENSGTKKTIRKSIYTAEGMDMSLNNDRTGQSNKIKNEHHYYPKDKNYSIQNKVRKSIYTLDCMDMTLIDDKTQQCNITVNELSHIRADENVGAENTKEPAVRTTIYNNEVMDLTLSQDILEHNKTETKVLNLETKPSIIASPKTKDLKEIEVSLCDQNNSNAERRKTLFFDQNNDMSIDQSFTPADNYPTSEKSLNVAKMKLARHIGGTTLANKSKITNKDDNSLTTPAKFRGVNRMFHVTPRLSLLEFTAHEKRIEAEERLQNSDIMSPLRNKNSNKRLPVNLTPVLSIPKKRQTLVFDDCQMNESNTSSPDENIVEEGARIELTNNDESVYISKPGLINHEMELSGIVANESVLQNTPKQRKSRIPIPVNSGKKDNSYSFKEAYVDLEMDVDNLTQSIQIMRRATTFAHQRDMTVEDIEVVPATKTSIFEGNPITISDVTVFYEAQRNSNCLVPQTETSLTLDKDIMSDAIEKAKKSLENRYLNLTLEDIEKTHLSLVRISYEDEVDDSNAYESAYKQEVICVQESSPPKNEAKDSGSIENKSSEKNLRGSVNYVRNTSTVCRKCKRCQETFLNETTSSASDSFVLPPLPPLPNLGLDRLRRLRKRPNIAEVTALWQRVSLDSTIINTLDISDDESLDGEIEDESSPIMKIIQKYEEGVSKIEMDLLDKQRNVPSVNVQPFVLRLDNILSTNLSNWIFDFQMQCRGILLFTHKRIYTFSVLLTFEEVDPLGYDIIVKSVKMEKGNVPEKNWKPMDFVIDFQLKLNLPFDIQSLCKGSSEADIFKMLQSIDQVCLDTITMGKSLQRICFANQSSILRDECRTYVRKVIRKIAKRTDCDLKYVEKTEFKVELLNLKRLSFKDIFSPPLHNFCEEIHLLPTGLLFLQEFLQSPFSYVKRN